MIKYSRTCSKYSKYFHIYSSSIQSTSTPTLLVLKVQTTRTFQVFKTLVRTKKFYSTSPTYFSIYNYPLLARTINTETHCISAFGLRNDQRGFCRIVSRPILGITDHSKNCFKRIWKRSCGSMMSQRKNCAEAIESHRKLRQIRNNVTVLAARPLPDIFT